MKQFVLTCSMGKRLIAKGIAQHPDVRTALASGKLVIVAGSTNGYVAQEVLTGLAQAEDFDPKGFRRGTVLPPDFNAADARAPFPGDVVIAGSVWEKGKTIFDVADDLSAGDVILKGANAVDPVTRTAGVLIGHPQAGTSLPVVSAVTGRRVKLIVPVGMEKRIDRPVADAAADCNALDAEGPGMLVLPGEVFTELDAIGLLTGATASLLAAGGVYGAEGSLWVGVSGQADQINAAADLIASVAEEPPCRP